MKENNKMILIISIVAIIVLAIIGYFIFDNYYNADERAAQKARERAFEAELIIIKKNVTELTEQNELKIQTRLQ